MGKNLLIKITMGKPPNEMGNCPFTSPLVTPLQTGYIPEKYGIVGFVEKKIALQNFVLSYSDTGK
jgi:hypothetical protein